MSYSANEDVIYGGTDYSNSAIGGIYGNGWGFGGGGTSNAELQARANYVNSAQGAQLMSDTFHNFLGRGARGRLF